MRKITKKMINEGLLSGVIEIINSPHDDGAVCSIGEYWFYFGELTVEQESAESYLRNVPLKDIVDEIYTALEELRIEADCYKYEYDYYYYYIMERLSKKKLERGGEYYEL